MKKLETIDGATLMSHPLQSLNFVVDTLLSQGLHILAGAPKVGKSWLALWLAVTVAKGGSVWGLSVKQGTTLYLQSAAALGELGIAAVVRRSNGKRLIELHRADSADGGGAGKIVPVYGIRRDVPLGPWPTL